MAPPTPLTARSPVNEAHTQVFSNGDGSLITGLSSEAAKMKGVEVWMVGFDTSGSSVCFISRRINIFGLATHAWLSFNLRQWGGEANQLSVESLTLKYTFACTL